MSELADWIRLSATPGVGCLTARKLLSAFGLPAQIFATPYSSLTSVVSERIARALCDPPSSATQTRITLTHTWCEQPGNSLITLADADYPAYLLDIPDPPILLYIKGRKELLSARSIAVVGSRNATAQGISNAMQFSASLSQSGLTIVSGMALGIDTAAHQGGLQGPGSTIAVIGTGADIVYPARNRELAHCIAENGCILSEYPLGTQSIAANFPRRNRLISGLSEGILVIEAAAQSGSLITARMAAEQGRDVFAIPGSIHSPLSKGCHELIKQGAKLTETALDILQELDKNLPATIPDATTSPATTESPLLSVLGFDPVHPDTLSQRCNLEIGEVISQLLILELNGQVEVIAGGYYQRLSR